MNIIDTLLAQHGLTQDELPKKVTNKMKHLYETIEDIELSKADLKIEEDEETKQEMIETIEKAESYVEALSEEIIESITQIGEAKNAAAAPAAPAAAPASTNSNTASASAPTEKKKGSALPWIIGGVVLVLTLGAVNVMQEK